MIRTKEQIARFVEANTIEFVGDGWDNVVYSDLQKTKVFRFPKKDDGMDILNMEAAVLPKLVHAHMGATILPPVVKKDGKLIYAEYAFVDGNKYESLDTDSKIILLKKLGTFLLRLHAYDMSEIDEAPRVDYREKYSLVFEDIETTLTSILSRQQLQYARDVYHAYLTDTIYHTFQTALLHGDISFDHIYFEHGEISIIDWSDLHVADPAREFYHLLRDMTSMEKKILKDAYTTDDPHFWDRADIYPLLDTFEVLVIFAKKNQSQQIDAFLKRVDQDMHTWESQC